MEARGKLATSGADEGCAESDAFVEVDGRVACSLEVLQEMVQVDIKSRYFAW